MLSPALFTKGFNRDVFEKDADVSSQAGRKVLVEDNLKFQGVDTTAYAREGFVHSVESCGTVDGPGIRFVVFLSGCPLRCCYCHNPDTRKRSSGEPLTSKQLLKRLEPYREFLSQAGGGVTISGGEPMCQQAFVLEVIRGCHAMGLSVAIDTAGSVGRATIAELVQEADLFLLDIKCMDPMRYRAMTGGKLESTLEFALMLNEFRRPVWIRYVFVPGHTGQREDVLALCNFLKPLTNVERVEMLPFHNLGSYKWKELGLSYPLEGVEEPSESQCKQVEEYFSEGGIELGFAAKGC